MNSFNLQTQKNVHNLKTRLEWRLVFGDLLPPPVKQSIQYFHLFFPMQYIVFILQHTNEYLELKRGGTPISKALLLRFLGIRLCMAINRTYGETEEYWDVPSADAKTVLLGQDYGSKYGMPYHEFKKINSNFRLASFVDNAIDQVRRRRRSWLFV